MSFLQTQNNARPLAGSASGSTYNPYTATAGPSNPNSNSGPGPAYTVLRIKRKATDAPLSSLVIQDSEPRLRAKRRRDVSGRPRGVFRLAETVPDTWVGKGQEGQTLKSRIQGLLATTTTSEPSSPSIPSTHPHSHPDFQPHSNENVNENDTSTKTSSLPSTNDFGPAQPPRSSSASTSQYTHTQTQFRVVRSPPPLSPRMRAMLPPKLVTNAETEAEISGDPSLVFVDAHAVSNANVNMNNKSSNRALKQVEDDKEVAMFSSMLDEYLQLEKQNKPEVGPEPEQNVQDDEWVYDLYYRDIRTSAVNGVGMGVGDGVTIGELLGYEEVSPTSSISSEAEDEADEDSNEEDYYRNDYPEDEIDDDDDDVYNKDGRDEEDDEWSESDGDGAADERGEWDYR